MNFIRCFLWLVFLTLSASEHIIKSVSDSVTVAFTSGNNPSQNLTCQGVSPELKYYIQKPLTWSFKSAISGNITLLTTGFYLATPGNGKYLIEYHDVQPGYNFTLTVNNPTDSDDGEYICDAMADTSSTVVLERRSVYLHVTHPVATLNASLAGVDSGGGVHPVAGGLDRQEGRYTISCVANGSNPEPQINITVNDEPAAVTMVTRKDVVDQRVWYTGTGYTTVVITPGTAVIQCAANIPFEWQSWPRYPNLTTNMTVNFTEITPNITCQQPVHDAATPLVTFHCKLTTVHRIYCDRIRVYYNNGQGKMGHLNYSSSDLNATCSLATEPAQASLSATLARSTQHGTSLSIKYSNVTIYDITVPKFELTTLKTTTVKNNSGSHDNKHLHLPLSMALALIIIVKV